MAIYQASSLGTSDPNGGNDVRTGGAGPGSGRSTNDAGSRQGVAAPAVTWVAAARLVVATLANGRREVAAERPYISYGWTHPDEDEPDPDGLNQARRMKLNELAIQLILAVEPTVS